MATHRPKWHRVKLHRNYTVEEAASTLEVSKGTIRRWVKRQELPTIEARKPILIHGSDLKGLGQRRKKSKVTCKPHEFYCFSCKAPQSPAGNMADFFPRTSKSGNLKALCGECETIMNKHVSRTHLPALAIVLDISEHQAAEHLVESPITRSNDH